MGTTFSAVKENLTVSWIKSSVPRPHDSYPDCNGGTFRLEPNAGCGDLVSARVRVDGQADKVSSLA